MALRLKTDSASERVLGVSPEGVGRAKEPSLGGRSIRCALSPIVAVVRWGDCGAGLCGGRIRIGGRRMQYEVGFSARICTGH